MKRRKLAALLAAAAICLAGCGSRAADAQNGGQTASTAESTQGADGTISGSAQDAPGTELPNAGVSDVYPGETELTEVSMGVTEDICTLKVPLDYVLIGGYYDESGNEVPMDGLNSATATVREAMDAGSFDTEKHLAAFTATSVDGDAVRITATMYLPDTMTWDEFKACYPEAVEIENGGMPGLYYHAEAFSGTSLAVSVKVSDEITLSIVYEGPMEERLGTEAAAQRLYELVALK